MATQKNWVDYKEIKTRITMEMVLERYGLFDKLKKSGHNLVSCCPIHKGSNPRQFSVNLEKNLFNCFGNCKTGGNVMDFVALMEFGNKENVSIRQAALLLQKWFLNNESAPDQRTQLDSKEKQEAKQQEKREECALSTDEVKLVNPPLKFSLNSLNPDHPFFTEREILPATVKHFGLGFCTKGMMKDRIAIPIRDHEGQLVAYCGRAVSREQIEEEGKYKLPANFAKQEVVYNLHRQPQGIDFLILVESYISVWKLHQSGFPNVAALMGSSLGKAQEKLIVELLGPAGCVVTMFDADEDGEKCTEDCVTRLGSRLFIKAADISPYAKKPHQLAQEDLQQIIAPE